MIIKNRTSWKLAAILGVAGAIALAQTPAEARSAHHARAEARAEHVHHHPAYRGSYDFEFAPRGGLYGEPNGSDNYNPNEGG